MNGPNWALGYDVKELKVIAQRFAKAHKPHVHGAFGLLKERDIAAAKKNGQLFCGDGFDAVVHQSRQASRHRDFRGKDYLFDADTMWVRNFAVQEVGAAAQWLQRIGKRGFKLAIEIFEEDRFERSAVLMAETDAQYVMTKVSAGGDIKTVYSNQSDLKPLPTSSTDYPTLIMLDSKFCTGRKLQSIRDEISEDSPWAQHYSSYNKRKSWTAFSLRGYDPQDPGFIIKPAEMSQAWKNEHRGWEVMKCEDTVITNHFPNTWELLAEIPCGGLQRVRFMRLRGKDGELSRHADITDRAAGTQPHQIARLHIPIFTDPSVFFHTWGLRGNERETHMGEGELWYLDTRKPHRVINPSNADRIHLVADIICNEETQKWFRNQI